MTKEIYTSQRNQLLTDAQQLIDAGKMEDANAKMEEIKALDAKYDEEAKLQANLNALTGAKVPGLQAMTGVAETADWHQEAGHPGPVRHRRVQEGLYGLRTDGQKNPR